MTTGKGQLFNWDAVQANNRVYTDESLPSYEGLAQWQHGEIVKKTVNVFGQNRTDVFINDLPVDPDSVVEDVTNLTKETLEGSWKFKGI